MNTRQKTLLELQKLNQKLDQIGGKNKYFIFSANPFKFVLFNLLAGMFHSLGALFGTLFLAGAIVYIFSQANIDLIGPLTKLLEESFSRIDWQKVMPVPQIDVSQFRL